MDPLVVVVVIGTCECSGGGHQALTSLLGMPVVIRPTRSESILVGLLVDTFFWSFFRSRLVSEAALEMQGWENRPSSVPVIEIIEK